MTKKSKTPRTQDPEEYPQAEPLPEGYHTWTQEQVDAWGLQLLRELEAHVYTEEEKAAAAHFSAKQESAHWVPVPKTEDTQKPTARTRKDGNHGEEEETGRHDHHR